MGSVNNWLGFSLSPQQLGENSVPHLGFNSDAQISTESCFDLPEASPIPSLNLPAPHFGILEAFNRNSHSQDWKEVNMNNYSCSSLQDNNNEERPKLENFLGVGGSHSFPDHHHPPYNIYHHQPDSAAAADMNSTTIGLSMIKNWLRNNPAPPEDQKEPPAAAAPQPPPPQTLSLSMSTGTQSSSSLPSDSKAGDGQTGGAIESVPRKSIDTFGQRTSIYRGVTRHRWTGRYEAHLWDNSCRREGQTRKGRQVYLGGYDKEEKAARAYDLAALKYWGTTTTTNFPMSNYEKEIEEMKNMTRQEYVASLRRKSSGFSRGASIYRGVTRHHQHGRWQARIGRVAGNKDLYLGTFSTQEEAAEAYDIAAIKFRGLNAVTNFEINRYDVKSILESSTLPIGGAAKRLKEAENAEMALDLHRANEANLNLHLAEGQMSSYGSGNSHPWPAIGFQQAQPLGIYPYAHQRLWCKQEQDSEISHGFNENINHQLQLGNTQNFFMNNIMSLDSSSMDSSSVAYGNGDTNVVPMMGTVVVPDGNQSGYMGNHEEGMFGSSAEAYQQARNLYYASSAGLGKPGLYDQSPAWIPTGVPTISPRTNMAVPTFTVWNDT